MMRVKIRCNEEEMEDLIDYNTVLDFIENDYQVDDDTLEVRKILEHEGPLTKASHPDRYKGSTYNILVEWETRERTWIPPVQYFKNPSEQGHVRIIRESSQPPGSNRMATIQAPCQQNNSYCTRSTTSTPTRGTSGTHLHFWRQSISRLQKGSPT